MGVEHTVYLIDSGRQRLPPQIRAAVDQPLLPAHAQQGAATQALVAHGRAAAYGAGTAYGGNAGGVAAA